MTAMPVITPGYKSHPPQKFSGFSINSCRLVVRTVPAGDRGPHCTELSDVQIWHRLCERCRIVAEGKGPYCQEADDDSARIP